MSDLKPDALIPRLARALERAEEAVKSGNPNRCHDAACNVAACGMELEKLAAGLDVTFSLLSRMTVAHNADLPEDALASLAADRRRLEKAGLLLPAPDSPDRPAESREGPRSVGGSEG